MHELLVERAYLKATRPDGTQSVCAILKDPRPLDAGKTAWHAFTAWQEFWGDIRDDYGHRGILVYAVGQDGLLKTALETKIREEMHLRAQRRAAVAGDPMSSCQHLLDWMVLTECFCHSVHNGAKKGCQQDFGADLLRWPEISILQLHPCATALIAYISI